MAGVTTGCASHTAPDADALVRDGQLQFQDVSIRREGDTLHLVSRPGDTAWGSTGMVVAMLLMCVAIPFVVGRSRSDDAGSARWRWGTAALFLVFTVAVVHWSAARLLLDRTTDVALSSRSVRIHNESLWGVEDRTLALGDGDALSLCYMRSGKGSTLRTWIVRLHAGGERQTLLVSFGDPEHQPQHEALRDALAQMMGVRSDPEVDWVYLAW